MRSTSIEFYEKHKVIPSPPNSLPLWLRGATVFAYINIGGGGLDVFVVAVAVRALMGVLICSLSRSLASTFFSTLIA